MKNTYKYDITALGELLIDFTPAGTSTAGNPLFEMNPGGAPANVLAILAKFGKKTAFLGKVGEDNFGRFLRQVLQSLGIDDEGLVADAREHTTLAFVHLQPDGDRSFDFLRNPGADEQLRPEEINPAQLASTRLFHFGSLSMTREPARTTTLQAVAEAKRHGAVITYDPNLRLPLWASAEQARERMLEGFAYADIVKISEEELTFLTDTSELAAGTKALQDRSGTKLLVVSLGEKGCYYGYAGLTGHVAGVPVKAVDTTGAGDAFFGALLYRLLEAGTVDGMTERQLEAHLAFACAAGALTTLKRGAIPALPELRDVQDWANR